MVRSAAAVFFRDQRGQEPGIGERADKFGRIGALAVERAPIFTREPGAERTNGLADLREFVGRLLQLGVNHCVYDGAKEVGLLVATTLPLSAFRAAPVESSHRIPREHIG
jgi:hypothetical protein